MPARLSHPVALVHARGARGLDLASAVDVFFDDRLDAPSLSIRRLGGADPTLVIRRREE